nr:hypothetical protein [Neisseria sp. HSC-16F19]
MLKIPYGTTISYAELARRINNLRGRIGSQTGSAGTGSPQERHGVLMINRRPRPSATVAAAVRPNRNNAGCRRHNNKRRHS